jgi:hypothetical protein
MYSGSGRSRCARNSETPGNSSTATHPRKPPGACLRSSYCRAITIASRTPAWLAQRCFDLARLDAVATYLYLPVHPARITPAFYPPATAPDRPSGTAALPLRCTASGHESPHRQIRPVQIPSASPAPPMYNSRLADQNRLYPPGPPHTPACSRSTDQSRSMYLLSRSEPSSERLRGASDSLTVFRDVGFCEQILEPDLREWLRLMVEAEWFG